MTFVLVTHAPEEEARASLVAAKLDALGYQVRQDADIYRPLSPFERRKLAAEIDKAGCVIVLWSREAAEAPALRIAAERAKASGKLRLARLDSAAPPMGFAGANLANWFGRDQSRAWRAFIDGVTAAAPLKPARKGAAPAATKAQASAEQPAAAKKSGGGAAAGIIAVLALLAAGGAAVAHFVLHLF